MRHLLEAGTVEPAAVVLGEATHGDVCIGHRGRAELEVVLEGVAGHASVPERASNALDLLGAALDAVRDAAGEPASDAELGRSSLVATMVDVRPETRNVIPDEVVVALDWRTLPGATEESLLEQLRSALTARVRAASSSLRWDVRIATELQRTYTGVEAEWRLFSPGFLMSREHPVVRAAASAVGRRSGGAGPADVRPWGFATDGGWSCGLYGIPTVGFAPGEERYAHTNRERLDVAEARWSFERYGPLVAGIQLAVAG
jgi:acetylornithine deacetylase/succinyl-diaminopimelate desuccinylase-like protein